MHAFNGEFYIRIFLYSFLLTLPLTLISSAYAANSGGVLSADTVAKANALSNVNELKENQVILKQNDKEWICKPVEKILKNSGYTSLYI